MKYLIIGNSAAAIGAVEGIRSKDADGEINVVSYENHHTYSRPLISYLIVGKIDKDQMYYRPMDFYLRNRVQVYLGEKAVRVMPEEKLVRIAPTGLNIDYDCLLITTGGSPLVPPCFAGYYDNLVHFHGWDDIIELSARIKRDYAAHVVVVGGGLIGLKAAESLTMLGQKVTVIEAADHVLNSILDADGAEIVTDYLRSKGINILLNNPVTRLEGDTAISNLLLQDGTRISCDLVVLAAGVKPDLSWLEDLHMDCDKGILVNQSLQTSLPDIYAAGDIAQVYDETKQEYKLMPVLPEAYRQGRTAGLNMAGGNYLHHGQVFNSIPLLGLDIVSAGTNSLFDAGMEVIQKRDGLYHYRRLLLQNNVLKGFIMIGDIKRCGIMRGLIEKQIDTSDFKDRLTEDDFGLLDIRQFLDYNQPKGGQPCQPQ